MGAELGRGYADLLPLSLGALSPSAPSRSGRVARRPLEPARHDEGVLLRHRHGEHPHRLGYRAAQIALGLALVGVFAAIYHPVGIAMLVANAGERGPGPRS